MYLIEKLESYYLALILEIKQREVYLYYCGRLYEIIRKKGIRCNIYIGRNFFTYLAALFYLYEGNYWKKITPFLVHLRSWLVLCKL